MALTLSLSPPRRDWRPERPSAAPIPEHRAEDLTGVSGLARIALGEQVYTLRITRAGKLILTK